MFELWQLIGWRDTSEKPTKLREQRALTYWPIGTPLTEKVPIALRATVILFELRSRSGS
jgi:hypothetical protein